MMLDWKNWSQGFKLKPDIERRTTLHKFRQHLQNPLAAGLLCSLLVLITRPFGQEAAQAFRRLVDRVVSRNDSLFEYASSSTEAANNIVTFQAWGAWIIYGLTAGLLAMWVTRSLARGPASWLAISIVVIVWAGVYLLIWRWDNELQFALGRASSGMGPTWGPWLHAASFGFFGGFVIGLILAATPWRAGNKPN